MTGGKGRGCRRPRSLKGGGLRFQAGSLVEVRSRFSRYRDAWLEATVTDYISEERIYLVSYAHASSPPLNKMVPPFHLRPRPPPPPGPNALFGLHQCVEAFHNEGWRKGVVCKLPADDGDGVYTVRFPVTGDESRFKAAEMRRRMGWWNGEWIAVNDDQGQHHKSTTPSRTKSAFLRRKSYARRRSTDPVLISSDDDDGDDDDDAGDDNINRSKSSVLKRKEGAGQEYMVGPSQGGKKSKGESLEDKLEIANDMSKDNCDAFFISLPTSIDNDGEIAGACDAVNLMGKAGYNLQREVELSQTFKKTPDGCGMMMDCGYKNPPMVEKYFNSEILMVESAPVSFAMQHHFDSPHGSIVPNCEVGRNSQSTTLLREIHHEQGLNGTSETAITGRGSSYLVEGFEHRSEKASFSCSAVEHESTHSMQSADQETDKGEPRTTEITRRRRKRVVARPRKLRVETSDVSEQIEECEAGIPPNKKITFTHSMVSEQLEKGTEPGEGEDTQGLVEPFNHLSTGSASSFSSHHGKALESKSSLSTTAAKENSYDDHDLSLSNEQAVIMEDAHLRPQIESTVLDAESVKSSAAQQPSVSKSSLSFAHRLTEPRAEALWQALPSMEDRSHGHSELIPSGSLSGKIEMERITIDPLHTGSSFDEDNACHEGEFSSSRLLSEKAFVQIEDGALLDPIPHGSSISRGDVIRGPSKLIPCTSSGSPVEMEQAPCDPQSHGSLARNKDIHDHDEAFQSASSSWTESPFVENIREPQSSFNELSGNGREREDEAGFCAQQHRELASPRPQSGRDNETALVDSSPMEHSSGNSTLSFSKKSESEFWKLLESREEFRALPQQPHFHSFLEYPEALHEGLAFGLRLAFTTLVREISSLRIVDSQEDLEKKVKALCFLESNGFNVQPVRARIEILQQQHRILSQSKCKKHSLEAKVLELEKESEERSKFMSLVDEVISEIGQRLTDLQAKRAGVELKIRRNDSMIVDLKRDVKEAEEAGASAEGAFSAASTAPW